ncbi:MAG: TrbI/VirB10 family protein [Neisseriaceae bacterium]|nr:TrbI/VirB10 family protein [Neisseriaceae bacterium]
MSTEDYKDLWEDETQQDGKHILNDNGSNMAERVKKFILITGFALFVILGLGGLTVSWVRGKLHGEPKEQHTESVRNVSNVPEHIGNPQTLPQPKPTTQTDNKAEDDKPDERLPETPPQTTVTETATSNENKAPSLKDRRLASNMGDTPQNATPQAAAVAVRLVKNMNLTLIKGTKIPCVLENNIVSEQDGFTSCVVSHDIYSGNAKTLLIEKGSRITGMYSGNVRHGNSRLQIIWDRIITPFDLAIDLNSPSTDRLGASGVTGKVDNRWGLRIGSALLISLISDSIEIAADRRKNVVMYPNGQTTASDEMYWDSNTRKTTEDIAKKILEKYIDLPPIIYIEEGKTVQIYVQQDIDFSNAYRIKKTMYHN